MMTTPAHEERQERQAEDRRQERSEQPRPVWDEAGEPANLAAAAQDAMEWLRVFELQDGLHLIGRRIGLRPAVTVENQERLRACITALESHLGTEETPTDAT